MRDLSALPAVAERLEARTECDPNGGCWLWSGVQDGGGYGRLWVGGKMRKVHRLAYEAYIGPIPDGLYVLHRCDVRCCINPQHLFLGTQANNMADMCAKGRQRDQNGEAHPSAKLTEDDVREIRELFMRGVTQREIGRRYGVSQVTISQIKTRARWAHVHGTPHEPILRVHGDGE